MADLWHQLALNEFVVEDFKAENGLRFAAHLVDDRAWSRLSRDALIAGHVGPGDVLWTSNARDFRQVGLAADQIQGV